MVAGVCDMPFSARLGRLVGRLVIAVARLLPALPAHLLQGLLPVLGPGPRYPCHPWPVLLRQLPL